MEREVPAFAALGGLGLRDPFLVSEGFYVRRLELNHLFHVKDPEGGAIFVLQFFVLSVWCLELSSAIRSFNSFCLCSCSDCACGRTNENNMCLHLVLLF